MQRPHTSHSRHQSGSNNSSRMNHYHHHHSSNQLNSSHEAAVTPPRGYHATVGPGNAGEGQPYQYEGGPLTVLPPPPAPSYHHQVCSMGHSLKSFMPYSGSFFWRFSSTISNSELAKTWVFQKFSWVFGKISWVLCKISWVFLRIPWIYQKNERLSSKYPEFKLG